MAPAILTGKSLIPKQELGMADGFSDTSMTSVLMLSDSGFPVAIRMWLVTVRKEIRK